MEHHEHTDLIPQEESTVEQETTQPQNDEVESLRQKLREVEENYLRTHADFDNAKKRLEREKYQLLEYAYEKFAKDLLPVVDSLEAAFLSACNDQADQAALLEKLKEGISLTLENFAKTLKKHGVEPVASEGEFDPHQHEAVMHAASDAHDEGQIVQTLQKGYRYKERILRPAMVSICKK